MRRRHTEGEKAVKQPNRDTRDIITDRHRWTNRRGQRKTDEDIDSDKGMEDGERQKDCLTDTEGLIQRIKRQGRHRYADIHEATDRKTYRERRPERQRSGC